MTDHSSTSAISHSHSNSNRPKSEVTTSEEGESLHNHLVLGLLYSGSVPGDFADRASSLRAKYELSREQHRQDNPIPETQDYYQLSELRTMPYRDRIRKASIEQLEAHPELSIKPKIYIASKAKHRPRWRHFRDILGYDIISKWIDIEDKFSQDNTGMDYRKLWLNCVQDVKDCDVLVMYAETGEHMKGALIELGMALSLGREIIVTGDLGDNGTWWNHPKVQVSDKSIEDLMVYIYG